MLNNLTPAGQRILLLVGLVVGVFDVIWFFFRCQFSPPISPLGVLAGLAVQALGLVATCSTLEYFKPTARILRTNTDSRGKLVVFCVAIFLVGFSFYQKSVLYGDTWPKGRGAHSTGDQCSIFFVAATREGQKNQ